jgi:uncharacterized OsmC-like protein
MLPSALSLVIRKPQEPPMSGERIRLSIDGISNYFSQHPEKACGPDPKAVAVVEEGLRCRVEGSNGAILVTDMPKGVGGAATAPTPGWFLRAALASCDATMIAMRAAQLGVTLTSLEVTVESESDNRGLLGLAGAEFPGPLAVRIVVRLGSEDVPAEQLRQIVKWAEDHSPVGDAVRRAIPSAAVVEVV